MNFFAGRIEFTVLMASFGSWFTLMLHLTKHKRTSLRYLRFCWSVLTRCWNLQIILNLNSWIRFLIILLFSLFNQIPRLAISFLLFHYFASFLYSILYKTELQLLLICYLFDIGLRQKVIYSQIFEILYLACFLNFTEWEFFSQ